MGKIMCYTRKPINNILYDPKLAYSCHFAYSDDGVNYYPLNHNSGVLFAKGVEEEDGSIVAMSLQKPYVFEERNGVYRIAAVRVLGDGDADETSKGKVLLFTTKDFTEFVEDGLYKINNGIIEGTEIDYEKKVASFGTPEKGCVYNGLEGAVYGNSVDVPDKLMERIKKKLLTPHITEVDYPAKVCVRSKEQLSDIKAECFYSDGTSIRRNVRFNLADVDFSKSGEYEISGEIEVKHFDFPVAYNRADPCVMLWEGKYYFISTNDADGNKSIYVKTADTLEELGKADDHLILDAYTYDDIGGLLWAPEFHEIDGRLYIFHAATPEPFFCEESHIMELREGGNPICREDWSRPRRIVRKDGTDLCEQGKVITLDMTCFFWEGDYYVSWSQREFLPKDLGAWLYIAKLNREKPWMLASDPIVLSKPDYGWGNNHTFVEEGPFTLVSDGKLYLTFSGAAVDTSYVVSYLVIEPGKDLLNPENWRKNNYPILTSRSVEGEYGTGHNAYMTDTDGLVYNTYHARPGTEGVRSSGIRRVHFDIDGAPVLDVTEEEDMTDELKKVKCKLIVE